MDRIRVVVHFCMHSLMLLDRGALTRRNVIQAFKDKDKAVIEGMKVSYGIKSDKELDNLIYELRREELSIKLKMKHDLLEMPEEEVISIMNDSEVRCKFVKKYVKTEEENKNDKLFQCYQYLYGCKHGG